MKRISSFIPMVLALLLFSACKNYDDVKQFMAELSAAIEKNDTASIEKMYPDAVKADSLVLTFDAEKAQMETNDDGSIKVDLGEGKDIIVMKNEGDGSMTVKSSHGIFAYPADKLTLGKKAGQYADSLDDKSNAERMADTLFVGWLQGKILESMKSLVKITKSEVSVKNQPRGYTICSYTVTVANETDQEIGGNDYTVTAKETWTAWDDGWLDATFVETKRPSSSSKALTGKTIPAKGSATYTWNRTFDNGARHSGFTNFGIQSTINYTPSQSSPSYKFTGKEYEEYRSQKAN